MTDESTDQAWERPAWRYETIYGRHGGLRMVQVLCVGDYDEAVVEATGPVLLALALKQMSRRRAAETCEHDWYEIPGDAMVTGADDAICKRCGWRRSQPLTDPPWASPRATDDPEITSVGTTMPRTAEDTLLEGLQWMAENSPHDGPGDGPHDGCAPCFAASTIERARRLAG